MTQPTLYMHLFWCNCRFSCFSFVISDKENRLTLRLSGLFAFEISGLDRMLIGRLEAQNHEQFLEFLKLLLFLVLVIKSGEILQVFNFL